MRAKFNLDTVDIDTKLAVLVHGAYGVGKTRLEGDFLSHYKAQGKKVRFINIGGEDGYLSLAALGLGEAGETVDTIADFNEAVDAAKKDGIDALAIDSLPAYSVLHFRANLGGELRYPDPTKDGQFAQMKWGQIKMGTKSGVLRSRGAAPFVFWVAAHDSGVDPIQGGGKQVTPDLVGKDALASIGWFDFVLHMRAQTVGPGKVNRWLEIKPDETVATRQRLPRVILNDIKVPEGGGGWEAFLKVVREHTKPEEAKA